MQAAHIHDIGEKVRGTSNPYSSAIIKFGQAAKDPAFSIVLRWRISLHYSYCSLKPRAVENYTISRVFHLEYLPGPKQLNNFFVHLYHEHTIWNCTVHFE